VALSNVHEPLSGNLIVFPGSHHYLQNKLQEHGTLEGSKVQCTSATSVWGDGTLPDLGTPVQLLCSQGDVVLAHPKLAHRGGPNFSPGETLFSFYF